MSTPEQLEHWRKIKAARIAKGAPIVKVRSRAQIDEDIATQSKTCSKCNVRQPMASGWYSSKYSRDGVGTACRGCTKTPTAEVQKRSRFRKRDREGLDPNVRKHDYGKAANTYDGTHQPLFPHGICGTNDVLFGRWAALQVTAEPGTAAWLAAWGESVTGIYDSLRSRNLAIDIGPDRETDGRKDLKSTNNPSQFAGLDELIASTCPFTRAERMEMRLDQLRDRMAA